MSCSKIQICNLALTNLGADSIRSFDESNKRSRTVEAFYETARDYILSQFDWPFAKAFVLLQLLSEVSTPSGVFAYQLPKDCISPRDIYPLSKKNYWEIFGQMLFCKSSEEVYLYYTKRVIDPNEFSDAFISLLALWIAVRSAPSIAQDKELANLLIKQFRIEKQECWESNANIGNEYLKYDGDPNNDSFVFPEG